MKYTPKWIEEAEQATIFSPSWGEAWIKLLPILERVNTLLCIAASETDNEFLHDDIQKEIENVA